MNCYNFTAMKRETSTSVRGSGRAKTGSVRSRSSSGVKGSSVKATQRVLPLGNGWVVKSDRSKTFTVVTETQKEAIDIAKSIAQAQHSELIIHTKDGNVKGSISYATSTGSKKAK